MTDKNKQAKTADGVRGVLVTLWLTAFVVVFVVSSGVLENVFDVLWLVLVAAGWATLFVVGLMILVGIGAWVSERRKTRKDDA